MRYDQIHPYFPLVSFWLLTHLRDVWKLLLFLSCWRCAMWASSRATLRSIPTRGSVQATTSTKAWRANGLTMSKCQSTNTKLVFLSYFFWGVWGVGYNSKILRVKRCKHVNYLMFVGFFGQEPPPPPPNTFMILTFAWGVIRPIWRLHIFFQWCWFNHQQPSASKPLTRQRCVAYGPRPFSDNASATGAACSFCVVW